MTAPLAAQPMPDVDVGLPAVSRRLREAGVLDLVMGAGKGVGWHPLPRVLDAVGAWHADLVRRHGDRRAAAAYLAAWIAGTPSLVVGLPAMVGGVMPEVDAADVHLHRHTQGFVDRYAQHLLSVLPHRCPRGSRGAHLLHHLPIAS